MAAQGAFGADFYDRSILRTKHRAYYRSVRPVIKIGAILHEKIEGKVYALCAYLSTDFPEIIL